MFVKSIHLKNFRHHVDTKLTFQEGITAFVGPNGAGKSTVFEALSYVLFGSHALRTRLKEITPIWAPKAQTEITLNFSFEGKDYEIWRSQDNAKLKSRAGEIVQGQMETTRFIENLLRMNFDQFTGAFFTEQKKIEFLSRLKSRTDRESFILEMLGYDKIDQFLQHLRDRKKNVKAELSNLQNLDIENFSVTKRELEDLQSQIVNAKRLFIELSTRAEQISHEINSIKPRINSLIGKNNELIEAKAQLRDLDERIAALSSDFDPLALKNAECELSSLQIQLARTREQKDKLMFEISNLREEMNFQRASLDTQQKQRESDLTVFIKLLSNIGSDTAVCPTCGQPLDHPSIAREHLAKKIETIRIELEKIKTDFARLQRKEQELTDLNNKLEQTNQKIRKLEQLVSEKERIIALLQRTKQVAETQANEKAKLIEKRIEISKQITELESAVDNLKKLEVRMTALSSALQENSIRLASLNSEIAEKQKRIDDLTQVLRQTDKLLQRKRSLEDEMNFLEDSDKLVAQFRFEISTKVRPYLSQIASKYLSRLTSGKISSVLLDKSFDYSVTSGDETINLLSGGEEDLVSLALRLSLSEMIATRSGVNFELLVLDEIFGYLDSERRFELLG
ncbi:MAG: AAA family ATPase, partial [Deltaproteobacteria bacterium]|nr:AAA family ATPase [Deltaproteobacteria bacterium]